MTPDTLAPHWFVIGPFLGQSQFGRPAVAFADQGNFVVVTKSGKQLFSAPIHEIDVTTSAVGTTVLHSSGQRIPLVSRVVKHPFELGDGGRGGLRRHVPKLSSESARRLNEDTGRALPPLTGFLEHNGARIIEIKPVTAWAMLWRILLVVLGLVAAMAAIFVPIEYL